MTAWILLPLPIHGTMFWATEYLAIPEFGMKHFHGGVDDKYLLMYLFRFLIIGLLIGFGNTKINFL